jgi:hypothetical protein
MQPNRHFEPGEGHPPAEHPLQPTRCPPYLYYAGCDGLTTWWQNLAVTSVVWPVFIAFKAVSTAIGGRILALDDGTNNNIVQFSHGAGNTLRAITTIAGVTESHMQSATVIGATPFTGGCYLNPGVGVPQLYFNGVNETNYVTDVLVNTPNTSRILCGARSTGNLLTGRLYRVLVWIRCPAMTTAEADNLMLQLNRSHDWSWLNVAAGARWPHLYDFYDDPLDVLNTTIRDRSPGGTWHLTGVANPPRVYHQSFYG